MDLLYGHCSTGSVFMLGGCWLSLNVFRNYYRSMLKDGPSYVNSPWYTASLGKRRIPLESMLKVVAVMAAAVSEIFDATDVTQLKYMANRQHLTASLSLGINGVTDLLIHYGCLRVPQTSAYLTVIFAFVVEGLIFSNHTLGRPSMDAHLHVFIIYLALSSALCALLEMYRPRNPLPALCRAFLILTQGTWFIHVGFIVDPVLSIGMTKWDKESHQQLMLITVLFVTHLEVNFVLMLAMGVLTSWKIKKAGVIFKDQPVTCKTGYHHLCSSEIDPIKCTNNETETI